MLKILSRHGYQYSPQGVVLPETILHGSYPPFSPSLVQMFFIQPHLEYAIQAFHPTRDVEALKNVQKVALKFVKGLQRVPYEAAERQL